MPAAGLVQAAASSPAATGATDISNLGSSGWEVQSSAVATQTGAQISTPGFSTSTWLPVSNDDAGAPGTEIEALLQNGKCPGEVALQPVNQATSGPNSVAWGYDSEESAGDTVPTLDSLNRFMSASDLSNLWQNTKFNQYHANYEPRCKTGYSFGTLCHFDTALSSRYGT